MAGERGRGGEVTHPRKVSEGQKRLKSGGQTSFLKRVIEEAKEEPKGKYVRGGHRRGISAEGCPNRRRCLKGGRGILELMGQLTQQMYVLDWREKKKTKGKAVRIVSGETRGG